jgi:beta-glucuronidase
MLPPRDTPTRERRSLVGLWRFALDPEGVGRDQGWADGLPAHAREMPVPASYNDIAPEPQLHDHVGDAWYETTLRVPRSSPRRAAS